jgi:hypothetical protein|tara:strand:+ start:140 stop:454 length:315 start_codon:yes stop_codon:yes gene_type:complete
MAYKELRNLAYIATFASVIVGCKTNYDSAENMGREPTPAIYRLNEDGEYETITGEMNEEIYQARTDALDKMEEIEDQRIVELKRFIENKRGRRNELEKRAEAEN